MYGNVRDASDPLNQSHTSGNTRSHPPISGREGEGEEGEGGSSRCTLFDGRQASEL